MGKPFHYTVGIIGVVLVIGLAVIIGREVLFPISDGDFAKQVDDAFQRHPMYQVAKREFPKWYAGFIDGAARRLRNGASDKDIVAFARTKVRGFRHIHAHNALRANYAKLDAILLAEVELLRRIEGSSSAACAEIAIHGRIKSPTLHRILEEPKVAQAFDSRATKILEAIINGRKQQIEYGKPTASDNRRLGIHLSARGWNIAEIGLVADRAQLAAAPSDMACKLVRRFYEALATFEPSSARSRILVVFFGPLLPTWTAHAAPSPYLESFS